MLRSSFFLIVLLLTPYLSAQEANDTSIALMDRWLSLESEIGSMQSNWSERKQHLEQQIVLLEIEKNALNTLIERADNKKNEVDEARSVLLVSQAELEKEQQKLDQSLLALSAEVQRVFGRLPPLLQDEWQEKLALLESDAASSSEKMERLLTFLKALSEFNERIAIHKTAMNLGQDEQASKSILVTQIYLGLSQAWYISDDGDYFGYGRAGLVGWKWWSGEQVKSELDIALDASKLLKLKQILENPTSAQYLTLPIDLR